MVDERRKLAIIGLGGQSRSELIPAALLLKDKCVITAICDINPEFVEATFKILPDKVQVFSDYNKLFQAVRDGKLQLDGVIASVPHLLYRDIVEQAVLADLPVFKEKPFANDLDEAKKISQLALKEGIQVYTVTKRQFYPSYSMGLQLLQEGTVGTPYMYSARHFIPHGNLYEGWRSSVQAAGGGVLIDMGYHLLDVILRYFGEVSQANLHWSNIAKPDYSYEVEDAASLHNWHPIGVQGVFQLAALSGPKEEVLEVRGTKGRLVVTKDSARVFNSAGGETDSYEFNSSGVQAVSEALEQYLQNSKSIWSQNMSHNMKIMRVIDMAYKRRFS